VPRRLTTRYPAVRKTVVHNAPVGYGPRGIIKVVTVRPHREEDV
jgi:hypothetical protein